MAQMRIVEHLGGMIAHGAALTAAAHLHIDTIHSSSSLGGQVSVSWSGCWLEWMPAMKSRHSSVVSRVGSAVKCSKKESLSARFTWISGGTFSGSSQVPMLSCRPYLVS